MRTRKLRRTLALAGAGGMLAAGITTSGIAKADTITGEGVFMPRGSTAQQFGGTFCRPTCQTVSSMPTSVTSQAAKLDAAVMATQGPVTVVGFSLSAMAVHDMVNDWLNDPAAAPAPERVWIVTTGNPLNRYGGTQRDRRDTVAIPAESPYRHLDVVNQYDSVADRPTRFGWYSMLEVSLGRHLAYDEVNINDPSNLVYRDGNTTYMLVPAKELKQLRGARFLRDIGWITEERYDEIDADRRAKIEADYDRPAYIEQGPGADWGNGIEPETLREEPNVDQWRGLRTHDGNNADPALPENPEDGGDMGVDSVADERQTNPSVHQRETSLDESLTEESWSDDGESLNETDDGPSQTLSDADDNPSTTSKPPTGTPASSPGENTETDGAESEGAEE